MTTPEHVTLEIEGSKLTLQPGDTFMHKEKEYTVTKLGNIQPTDYKADKGIEGTYEKQEDGTYEKVSNQVMYVGHD